MPWLNTGQVKYRSWVCQKDRFLSDKPLTMPSLITVQVIKHRSLRDPFTIIIASTLKIQVGGLFYWFNISVIHVLFSGIIRKT